MKLLLLLFFIVKSTSIDLVFEDIRSNEVNLSDVNAVFIVMNGWNCKDCIGELIEELKINNIHSSSIYFVCETTDGVIAKKRMQELIEKETTYFNKIVFNVRKDPFANKNDSKIFRHAQNFRTPAMLINSDIQYFFEYDELFKLKDSSKVSLDSKYLLKLKTKINN